MRVRSPARFLVIGVAALAGCAPAASASGADKKAAPAASASRADKKAIWGPVTVNGRSAFPTYHDLGVGILEMGLDWATVAPNRPGQPRDPADPAYQWPATIDYAIAQAAKYHMRILLQVDRAPGWASGHRALNYPPRHDGDLADFATAAARRYPSVHLWMISGEPDRKANFAPLVRARHTASWLTAAQAAAPHLYARMLDAGYGALKAMSRTNLVIGGNTFTGGDIPPRLWIENLRLPNGRPPRMDLYGHNPFSWRTPNLANPAFDPRNATYPWEFDFSDVGRLAQLVNRNLAAYHHRIGLFLSEWMIPTARDGELPFHTTRAVQARWITAGWRIVRRSSFIYALGWIHLYDDGPRGSQSGLLDVHGRPKPGYYAFKDG